MEKYFDNILFYLQRSGGGSVYWGELMRRFAERNSFESHFIQPKATTQNIVLSGLKFQQVMVEKYAPLKILRYLPLSVSLPPGSIFHSSYYRYSTQKSVANFVTVHDFIYEYHRSGLVRSVHKWQKLAAINNAKGIICISNSTKQDLLKFYPYIKSKKIKVIYNGVSEDFFGLRDDQLMTYDLYNEFRQNKYLLFIGHRTSYKNFVFAVNVVAALPHQYKLAIVGNKLSQVELELLEKTLKGRYIFLGNIRNVELNVVYNLAEVLLYPSSYEGFGIPIVEAFRCGCPVVAQNISAIPEIAGEFSLLVNGLDKEAFVKQIISLQNSNLRNNLKEAAYTWSLKFSWDKCYNELNEFYDDCTSN